MAFLEVEGVAIKTPSSFDVGIQDVSAPDSGRDITGLMHKNLITQKRTISLSWSYLKKDELATILNAFEAKEYFDVTYHDPTNPNGQLTKTFYIGDRSTPLYNWALGLYESLSFNIIER